MTAYTIVSDVGGDMSAQMAAAHDIHIMPMSFTLSGETYLHYADYRNFDPKEFYKRLRAGEPVTTAQVSIADATAFLEPLLAAGEDVLLVSFGSGGSGSFNACRLAVTELLERYPQRRVRLVDTLAYCLGEGLLTYHAALNRDKGMSLDENADDLDAKVPHMAQWFTVDDLHHLQRGGRCSSLSAFMGTMLNIRPVMHTDDPGKLVPVEKVRSHKKAIDRIGQIYGETSLDLTGQPVFIGHADDEEGALRLADKLRADYGVTDITVEYIGPVIGAHCGPSTIALFFLATHR